MKTELKKLEQTLLKLNIEQFIKVYTRYCEKTGLNIDTAGFYLDDLVKHILICHEEYEDILTF
jgi:hypothetical protein